MSGVRLVIQFTAANEAEADQRVAELAERCKHAQTEKGCHQFEVFRSALRPNVYTLLEHWESQADLDAHMAAMGGRRPTAPGTIRERYEHQLSD